jgi:hypothetical protein
MKGRSKVHNRIGGKEKWMELCEQAATEQDPKKLSVLVAAITSALDAKKKRLRSLISDGNPATDSP